MLLVASLARLSSRVPHLTLAEQEGQEEASRRKGKVW
jgi:hypothetical protein